MASRAGGLRAHDEQSPGLPGTPRVELSASASFDLLWTTLVDVLGTAGAATLLRRAAKRATPQFPELDELVIRREEFGYRCVVPRAWQEVTGSPSLALQALVLHLLPLLVELTGSVVTQRFERVPELRRLIVSPQEKHS